MLLIYVPWTLHPFVVSSLFMVQCLWYASSVFSWLNSTTSLYIQPLRPGNQQPRHACFRACSCFALTPSSYRTYFLHILTYSTLVYSLTDLQNASYTVHRCVVLEFMLLLLSWFILTSFRGDLLFVRLHAYIYLHASMPLRSKYGNPLISCWCGHPFRAVHRSLESGLIVNKQC